MCQTQACAHRWWSRVLYCHKTIWRNLKAADDLLLGDGTTEFSMSEMLRAREAGTDANQSEHERMKCTTVTPTFTVLHQNLSLGSLVEFEKSSKHKQTATWNHTKQARCNHCLMTLLQCLTTAF
ncbi:hypothetical protein SELMODRAFT_406776 [Selaginella moellendorffii]|uniref:Uncharacterized protein n=1 Tax=Selaginella moellendorffii TaxID=88036 RepID=D8R2W5_SELML|nr:hypothetical protein SELMODRAFT_406776 [Selaginella moellendorffii]